MASHESFDAAYILLLSRLWLDLQALRASIAATGSCPRRRDSSQAHAEAVLLELALLRQRCNRLFDRSLLTAQQRQRLQHAVEALLGLLTFEPMQLSSQAIRSIDRAQNWLFDEVHDLASQWYEPRRRAG